MRLLFVTGVVTLYVTTFSHAAEKRNGETSSLSYAEKAEGQKLVLDLARNFSSFYFECLYELKITGVCHEHRKTIFPHELSKRMNKKKVSLTFNAPADRIVSPLSFFIPLSLLSFGARGKTKRIFLDALGIPKSKTHLAKFGYEDLLNNLDKYDVLVKTKIFVPTNVTLKDNFVNVSTEVFHSEIEYVNVTDGFMDSGKINEFIAAQTNNNVTELTNSEIGPDLSIILVNTVYFRGTWKTKFLSSETSPRPFYPVNGESFLVPTMLTEGRFRYGRIDEYNCDFLELPYKSSSAEDAMSMFILLPDKGPYLEWSTLVQAIKSMKLERLLNSTETFLEVHLPKFRIETTLSLTMYLNQFFAPVLMKKNQKKKYPKTADFSGIFESSGDLDIGGESLMKIVVEVDEEGQRTAESSGILYKPSGTEKSDRRSRSAEEPEIFKVDRPFLALIVTKGNVLTEIFSINFPGVQFIPTHLLGK